MKGGFHTIMSTSVFAFLIVLGILIFFHEFGHLSLPDCSGSGLKNFLSAWTAAARQEDRYYRLSPVVGPLGGYVKMVGKSG
jgi:regulator of sigma E protease